MNLETSFLEYQPEWGARPTPGTIPELSVYELFQRNVAARPDHPALIFYDRKVSYRELDELVHRFGAGLNSQSGSGQRGF